jgi:hypothetical protein
MKVTLYGGPLDGQEIDVPAPRPPYLHVETRRGQVRRVHTYALQGDHYQFVGTNRRTSPSPPEEQGDD